MDAYVQVLDDFSGQIEWWILGSRLAKPAADAEVAAHVHAALLSLLERQRPSDEELEVSSKALLTLFSHYSEYCKGHRAELVSVMTQLGKFSMPRFMSAAEHYIFTVYPPDRRAIDQWVKDLHLNKKDEKTLTEAAFHANF